MKPWKNILLGLALTTCARAQEPQLTAGLSAMNAASYTAAGLPHAGVAPGARFVVLGKDFATETVEQDSPATTLAGVSAKITAGGSTLDGFVMLVAPTRIEVVLPAVAAPGTGSVTLTVNGKDLTLPIEIVESAPGIRTSGVRGTGTAYLLDGSGAPVTFASPAVVGDLIRVRTTGLGSDAQLASTSIVVGGTSVPAGGITRYPNGWDDIDFEVPAAEAGCGVTIAVVNRGRISNFGTFPVGARGTNCAGSGAPQGSSRVGSISLIRSDLKAQTARIRSDAGSGAFYSYGDLAVSGASIQTTGACYLQRTLDVENAVFNFTGLDAGPQLSVSGPNGVKPMPPQAPGSYSGRLGDQTQFDVPGVTIPATGTLYLDPGEYTVTGPGGADVGPFTARVTVAAPVTWTNPDTLGTACGNARCVDRASDLKIEWQGGDSKRLVTVQGISSVRGSKPSIGVIFTCIERSDKGSLTVPASILSALPPSAEDQGVLNFTVTSTGEPFTATGLDWGTISHLQFALRLTGYR